MSNIAIPKDRKEAIEKAIAYNSPRGGRDSGADITSANINKHLEFLIFLKNTLKINKNISISECCKLYRISSFGLRALTKSGMIREDKSQVGYVWNRPGFDPNKAMAKELIEVLFILNKEYKADLKARKQAQKEAEEESKRIAEQQKDKEDRILQSRQEAQKRLQEKTGDPEAGKNLKHLPDGEERETIIEQVKKRLEIVKEQEELHELAGDKIVELRIELSIEKAKNKVLIKRTAKAEAKLALIKQTLKDEI